MAIRINQEGDKISIELDNGHAASLKKIVSDYHLKGESEALSFMLAVLATAEGKKIEIGGETYLPSDSLKNIDKPQNNAGK